MTKQKRSTLKSYFRTGAYPTEQQFSNMLDSYVHKDDPIGMDSVEGLNEALGSKAEKAVTDLKDYAETGKVLPLNGIYTYNGMPVHSRALEALDTDFDPEAQEGDTTEVIVFCCGHGDGSRSGKGSLYLVYHSTISGYAYYTRFTSQNVPEDILRAFGEAVATSSADGLMSKADKAKLDGMAGDEEDVNLAVARAMNELKLCVSGLEATVGALEEQGEDVNLAVARALNNLKLCVSGLESAVGALEEQGEDVNLVVVRTLNDLNNRVAALEN